ncbi:hypothetical protein HK100_005110, partial [Physocladia obscura]
MKKESGTHCSGGSGHGHDRTDVTVTDGDTHLGWVAEAVRVEGKGLRLRSRSRSLSLSRSLSRKPEKQQQKQKDTPRVGSLRAMLGRALLFLRLTRVPTTAATATGAVTTSGNGNGSDKQLAHRPSSRNLSFEKKPTSTPAQRRNSSLSVVAISATSIATTTATATLTIDAANPTLSTSLIPTTPTSYAESESCTTLADSLCDSQPVTPKSCMATDTATTSTTATTTTTTTTVPAPYISITTANNTTTSCESLPPSPPRSRPHHLSFDQESLGNSPKPLSINTQHQRSQRQLRHISVRLSSNSISASPKKSLASFDFAAIPDSNWLATDNADGLYLLVPPDGDSVLPHEHEKQQRKHNTAVAAPMPLSSLSATATILTLEALEPDTESPEFEKESPDLDLDLDLDDSQQQREELPERELVTSAMEDIDTLYDIDDFDKEDDDGEDSIENISNQEITPPALMANNNSISHNTLEYSRCDIHTSHVCRCRLAPSSLPSPSFSDDDDVVHVGRWLRHFDEIDDTNDTDAGDNDEEVDDDDNYEYKNNDDKLNDEVIPEKFGDGGYGTAAGNRENDNYKTMLGYNCRYYYTRKRQVEQRYCCGGDFEGEEGNEEQQQQWNLDDHVDTFVDFENDQSNDDSPCGDEDTDSDEHDFEYFTQAEIVNRIEQLSRMKLQYDSRPLSQTVMIVNTMILLDP